MRPQGFVGLNPATAQDDLGWNDMGDEALYPSTGDAPAPAAKPVVLRQRDVLGKRFAAAETQAAAEAEISAPVADAPHQAAPAPAMAVAMPSDAVVQVVREVSARKTKAAFTLRLDQERHLRLRLASVVTRRSAQQLVCQALDQFLESLTEVEALARQVGSATAKG